MITALFWHSIQTYTGSSTALTIILTAIWPRYMNVLNHLLTSARITKQGLLSYFLLCSIQLPFLHIAVDGVGDSGTSS